PSTTLFRSGRLDAPGGAHRPLARDDADPLARVQVHGRPLGALPARLPGAVDEVEHLDTDREADRAVDERLVDVVPEALGDQRGAEEDEEAQREHLHGRVTVDERWEEHTAELQSSA